MLFHYWQSDPTLVTLRCGTGRSRWQKGLRALTLGEVFLNWATGAIQTRTSKTEQVFLVSFPSNNIYSFVFELISALFSDLGSSTRRKGYY